MADISPPQRTCRDCFFSEVLLTLTFVMLCRKRGATSTVTTVDNRCDDIVPIGVLLRTQTAERAGRDLDPLDVAALKIREQWVR